MTSMDPGFFKPFVEGTIKVLKVQCKVDVILGKPFLKGETPQPNFQIAGVIGLTSDTFTGTLTLSFEESSFLEIMGNMLGEKFETLTPDLQDGAGELLNMIFGHAKRVHNDLGNNIRMALPTVFVGSNLGTRTVGGEKVMVIPFKTDRGEFHIEINQK